jgi:glycosyltransferase involved in cell wall biosynthesis
VLGRRVGFADLLPAADAMLVTGVDAAPTLPVALAMAAGVPVVGVERPELGELLVDGVTALTVADPAPRALAQRVLDLRADRSVAQALASDAAARARELFSPTRFLQTYRALYGLVAAEEPRGGSLAARHGETA